MSFGDFFGPEFATPAEVIKEGLDRVLRETSIGELLRTKIRDDYLRPGSGGSHQREWKIFDQHLSGVRWSWPRFDDWQTRFAAARKWPFMWTRFAEEFDAFNEPPPGAVKEALEFFSAAEIRAWLKVNCISFGSPAPKKRAELVQRFASVVSWEQFADAALCRCTAKRGWHASEMEHQRRGILAHTATMTICTVRDLRHGLLSGYRWKLIVDDEDRDLPGMAAFRGRIEKRDCSQLPPFFPGDRTCLTAVPE